MAEAKKKINGIDGTTESGFKYSISASKLNNFELLDALYETETNPLLISKVITLLLGDEGKLKLMNHLREKDGTVPIDKLQFEVAEIFKNVKLKKS